MAIVDRFFSTTGAGAADGTTWADRAALFSAGNWSTVVTGFAFNGSDSLRCLVGPGTYTQGQTLTSALFANPPSAVNFLFIHGCDSSGVQLEPPDPDWISNEAPFDDSTFPVLATTGNVATTTLANCQWHCVGFTASGRNGSVLSGGHFNWISLTDSTANTSTVGTTPTSMTNSMIHMTGASYAAALQYTSAAIENVLLTGVTGTSGNRYGLQQTGIATLVLPDRLTIRGFGGAGAINTSTNVAHVMGLKRCTIANNGGDGVQFPSTAAQTGINLLEDCMITGNGGYNVNAQSNANVLLRHCRMRDGTSGNINAMGNFPTDVDNYTTDSDDASEYVDTASGDYQIKNTATIWGMGFGPSEQAPAGGGGASSYTFVG